MNSIKNIANIPDNFMNDLCRYKQLFKIAGAAAVAMLILIPVQIAVFTIWPFPESAVEWFQLFQNSWILGLLHLDLLYIINNTIVAIMYLALFFSMRQRSEGSLLVALILGLLGVAAYYASTPAFEMLSLSGRYVSGAPEAQNAALIASGEMLLAQWKGTAFNIYYILSAASLLIFAGTMIKSPIYGKAASIFGLISGVLMLIPSSAGSIGMVFSLASLIPWIVFTLLVAKKFLQIGRYSEILPGTEQV